MPDCKCTNVDSRQLTRAAGHIGEQIAELLSVCAATEREILSGLHPYWQGQARQSFEAELRLLAAELAQLTEDYQTLSAQLTKAAATYDRADDAALALIGKLAKKGRG